MENTALFAKLCASAASEPAADDDGPPVRWKQCSHLDAGEEKKYGTLSEGDTVQFVLIDLIVGWVMLRNDIIQSTHGDTGAILLDMNTPGV